MSGLFYQPTYPFMLGKINRDKREIDPQETLLDSLAQRKDSFGQKRFEVPLHKGVVLLVFAIFGLTILVLGGRLFQLSMLRHDEMKRLSEYNYQRVYYKQADRGVIYDRNYNQLVFNERGFSLALYKNDLPLGNSGADVIEGAASLSGLSVEEVKKRIKEEKGDRVFLKKDLSHEEVVAIRTKIDGVVGLYLEESIKRNYSLGEKASHLLGYLGRSTEEDIRQGYSSLDYLGKSGLESFYEDLLKGTKEKTVVKKDILLREVSREMVSEQEAGKSLVLWLDQELQEESYDALEKTVRNAGAEAGTTVILDVDTGGVLSLVSFPSFDNNVFSDGLSSKEWSGLFEDSSHPFWNRAVSGIYPSGSTIKPIVAMGALEEGIINPERIVQCQGQIEIENPWHEDKPWIFRDWSKHGPVDLRKAIAVSCNVYFYTIGGGYGGVEGLGVEGLDKYLSFFGWGEKTGIDLSGESKGIIPSPKWKKDRFDGETWLPGDTYNLSIGQGYLSVTPIQVASSYLPIVNGGDLLKPQIVREIVDQNRGVVGEFKKKVRREGFFDEENARAVREGMREAVEYGSSTMLQSLPVKAAAKTGTAQTNKKDYYHNWVAVFAPYDDPEIVMVVMVEDVPKEQVAALPVARDVLSWYFNNK